jgi:hypothetical protein
MPAGRIPWAALCRSGAVLATEHWGQIRGSDPHRARRMTHLNDPKRTHWNRLILDTARHHPRVSFSASCPESIAQRVPFGRKTLRSNKLTACADRWIPGTKPAPAEAGGPGPGHGLVGAISSELPRGNDHGTVGGTKFRCWAAAPRDAAISPACWCPRTRRGLGRRSSWRAGWR